MSMVTLLILRQAKTGLRGLRGSKSLRSEQPLEPVELSKHFKL